MDILVIWTSLLSGHGSVFFGGPYSGLREEEKGECLWTGVGSTGLGSTQRIPAHPLVPLHQDWWLLPSLSPRVKPHSASGLLFAFLGSPALHAPSSPPHQALAQLSRHSWCSKRRTCPEGGAGSNPVNSSKAKCWVERVLSRVPCVLGWRAGFSLGSKFCRERHFFEWERHPGLVLRMSTVS